uniref:EF-hand domain-containing protein n=1 Tax=Oryza barthii TaxID=65489 RepID=A0A0D3G5I8_9ORYZ
MSNGGNRRLATRNKSSVQQAASSVFAALDKDDDGKVSAFELRGCMVVELGEDVFEEAAAILGKAKG